MIIVEKPTNNISIKKKYEFANCSERILEANKKIKKDLKKYKNVAAATANNFRPI